MVTFEPYIPTRQYQKAAALGDAEELNWHPFRKIVFGIYDNRLPRGERQTPTRFS